MDGFSKVGIVINQPGVKYCLGCITCRGCSRCLVYSGVSMFPDQLSTDELVDEAQRTRFYVESITCLVNCYCENTKTVKFTSNN